MGKPFADDRGSRIPLSELGQWANASTVGELMALLARHPPTHPLYWDGFPDGVSVGVARFWGHRGEYRGVFLCEARMGEEEYGEPMPDSGE